MLLKSVHTGARHPSSTDLCCHLPRRVVWGDGPTPTGRTGKKKLTGLWKLNCNLAAKPSLYKLFQASPKIFLLLKKVTRSRSRGTWTMPYTWRDQDGRAKLWFPPGNTSSGTPERVGKVGWHRELPGNSYQPLTSLWR